MTFIAAFNFKEQEKDHLLFVTDGMCTTSIVKQNAAGEQISTLLGKEDNHQKLFRVGDSLIAGTGDGRILHEGIRSVRAAQKADSYAIDDSYAIAKHLQGFLSEMVRSEQERANFIVGGKDLFHDYAIFHVHYYGVPSLDLGPTIDEVNGDVLLDGGGSSFARNAWHQKNCSSRPKSTLEDAVTIAYELAHFGAESNGVNTHLQFGIVSNDRIARLYHPDIQIGYPFSALDFAAKRCENDEAFHEYLQEMTGIAIPVLPADATPKELIRNGVARHELKDKLDENYHALERALKYHSLLREQTASVESSCAQGHFSREVLDEMVSLRDKARLDVRNVLERIGLYR